MEADTLFRRTRDTSTGVASSSNGSGSSGSSSAGAEPTRRVTRSVASLLTSFSSSSASVEKRTTRSSSGAVSSQPVPRPSFFGTASTSASAASKTSTVKEKSEKESSSQEKESSRIPVRRPSLTSVRDSVRETTTHNTHSSHNTHPSHSAHSAHSSHSHNAAAPHTAAAKSVPSRYGSATTVATERVSGEKKFSTSVVGPDSHTAHSITQTRKSETKDSQSLLRERYHRTGLSSSAAPAVAEQKPSQRERERETLTAKAKAQSDEDDGFVMVEAKTATHSHSHSRTSAHTRTERDAETEAVVATVVAECVTQKKTVSVCVEAQPVSLAAPVVRDAHSRTQIQTHAGEIATATATPLATVEEDDFEDAHSHTVLLESVEELALSLAGVTRLVFSFLGDFGGVAATHYGSLCLFLPVAWQTYALRLQPVVREIAVCVEIAASVVLVFLEIVAEICQFLWNSLRPHRPDLLLLTSTGLVLCLFGGFFPLTIAAAEAFGAVGLRENQRCLREIQSDLQRAWDESARIAVTSNGNEGQNAQQSPSSNDNVANASANAVSSDLALRRLLVALSSVSPQRIAAALRTLSAGALTVWATLQSKHLQTMALANALSSAIETAMRWCTNTSSEQGESVSGKEVEATSTGSTTTSNTSSNSSSDSTTDVPTNNGSAWSQWWPYLSPWIAKLIALFVAWRLSRALALFHSAYRGGFLCSKYALNYLSHYRLLTKNTREALFLDTLLGGLLAVFGVYVQFSVLKLALPFPLSVVLLPLSLCELALQWTLHRTASSLSLFGPSAGIAATEIPTVL